MQAVAPSHTTLSILRAIARCGFSYAPTKALAEAAGWRRVDDDPDQGYVRYDMLMEAETQEWRPLSVMVAEGERPPWAFVTLSYFDEDEARREPFDAMFQIPAESLANTLGEASRSGIYTYPHRPDWEYSYAGWTLADFTLILVQDEFDIQFGMDVSLWILPAGHAVVIPVSEAYE